MKDRWYNRYLLVVKVLKIVFLIILCKLICHYIGVEVISLNPLFSGIIAANVFLMGFLLSGVLSDYKESEKLPGEVAASLETMMDEAMIIHKTKKAVEAKNCLEHLSKLTGCIVRWLHKKERTETLMSGLSMLSDFFTSFEAYTQANFIVRLKQEQHALRKLVIRIHTIRETDFIHSGYMIAEFTTALTIVGLILVRIDPFYESLFFVGVISFLLFFLILLIRDLDNPFGYYDQSSTEDISLKPLLDLERRLSNCCEQDC